MFYNLSGLFRKLKSHIQHHYKANKLSSISVIKHTFQSSLSPNLLPVSTTLLLSCINYLEMPQSSFSLSLWKLRIQPDCFSLRKNDFGSHKSSELEMHVTSFYTPSITYRFKRKGTHIVTLETFMIRLSWRDVFRTNSPSLSFKFFLEIFSTFSSINLNDKSSH